MKIVNKAICLYTKFQNTSVHLIQYSLTQSSFVIVYVHICVWADVCTCVNLTQR